MTQARPPREQVESELDAFLQSELGECPSYRLIEDGEFGWAFFVRSDDTTSYVTYDHREPEKLSIQWLGTSWKTSSSSHVLSSFQSELALFKSQHAALIEKLEGDVRVAGDKFGDFFDEALDEIRGQLGASAANCSSDDEEEQSEAISQCEEWVSNNLRGAEEVAVFLMARGVEEGERGIRSKASTIAPSRRRARP